MGMVNDGWVYIWVSVIEYIAMNIIENIRISLPSLPLSYDMLY